MGVDFDKLFSGFKAEAAELLDRIESSILALEEGYDVKKVNEIFRSIHTVKGSSGLFDLPRITTLAHSLENVLNLMRNEPMDVKMELVDLLLTTVDRLRDMVRNIEKSNDYEIRDLLVKLDAISETGRPGDDNGGLKEAAGTTADETTGGVTGETTGGAAGETTGGAAGDSPVESSEERKTDHPAEERTAPSPAEGERIVLESGLITPSTVLSEYVNGSTNLRIQFPEKYARMARNQGKRLIFVYYDALEQEATSLAGLAENVESIGRFSNIVRMGVIDSKLPPPHREAKASLPCFFLILTDLSPDTLRTQLNLKTRAVKELFNPRGPDRSPSTDSSAAAADSRAPAADSLAPAGESPAPVASSGGAAAPGPGSAGEVVVKEGETWLKVSTTLIDELINLAGESIIARNELMQKIERLKLPELSNSGKKMSMLVTLLQERIMKTRLQEIDVVFQRIPRIVRDVTRTSRKKVRVQVEGGNVELDKTLIDSITDPITHLIRNCIDHGIEPPDERVRLGKNDTGLLKVSASLNGGNVVLKVQDDGRGLNLEKIKNMALEEELLTERQAEEMSEEDIFDLIFLPGFSTAESVTDTSGRGVGMDVVRTNVNQIGGSVEVESVAGTGTVFRINLPQTLTIITCLLIRCGNRRFALPQKNIDELLSVDPSLISDIKNHSVYELRGRLLPLINLSSMFCPEEGRSEMTGEQIVVVRTDRHFFGLLVDEIINPEEFVVKPLGEFFSELTLYAGAGIMGDGEAILILDIPGLAKSARLQPNIQEAEEAKQAAVRQTVAGLSGYLLFEVFQQRFAVATDTLPRIKKINDDEIELFTGVEIIRHFDEIVPVVRLEDCYDIRSRGKRAIWYAIVLKFEERMYAILATEIINIISEMPELEEAALEGRAVMGQAIIDEHPVAFIDLKDLLVSYRKNRHNRLLEIWERAMRQNPESG